MNQPLTYDMGFGIEAFSTRISTPLDFEVVLPQHQAHSTKVAKVQIPDQKITNVDALITNVPGLRIGVKTADCVPILLYDPKLKAIAAVHSGWKGTLGNILSNAVMSMVQEYGSIAADLRAVIGPCIHIEAFEVGDELHEQFAASGYERFCQQMPDYDTHQRVKWHIDLPSICKNQLLELGLRHIEVRPECTYERHHEFYSARRLKDNFGQQRILNCIKLSQ